MSTAERLAPRDEAFDPARAKQDFPILHNTGLIFLGDTAGSSDSAND